MKNPLPDGVTIALLAFRLPVCGSSMSDSEGSDSDGSYGGRKKMRRDEAEEVTPLIQFVFYSCRVRRRTLQMSRSQRERILSGEMARTTVTRRFFLTMPSARHKSIIIFPGRSKVQEEGEEGQCKGLHH